MLGFLAGEAARDLRRAGRVGLSAILLITLSLAALGCFWLLSLNLGRAVEQWRERVRVVAYLREEPRGAGVDDLLARVQALDGVQRVRFVSRAEALSSLKRSLGAQASVVDQLPRNPLPASLEVTPTPEAATPDGTRELVQRLSAMNEVDEVQGGAEWVESLAQWQRLFQLTGLGVGAVLALAAILTVTTATTLVLHARRDEMEIMRLVGATEAVIRLPLLLQGMTQGLLGAALALAALVAAHAVFAPRLEPLLTLTLGLARSVFLSPAQMALLLAGGAMLGAFGGLLAKGRAYS
ncbi:MAG TPA: permease-like cell division protein FtsX [Methylomirabilota bacterium]|nr:permease-like cell division protein FtsX [Methylomirabilota bacterium]